VEKITVINPELLKSKRSLCLIDILRVGVIMKELKEQYQKRIDSLKLEKKFSIENEFLNSQYDLQIALWEMKKNLAGLSIAFSEEKIKEINKVLDEFLFYTISIKTLKEALIKHESSKPAYKKFLIKLLDDACEKNKEAFENHAKIVGNIYEFSLLINLNKAPTFFKIYETHLVNKQGELISKKEKTKKDTKDLVKVREALKAIGSKKLIEESIDEKIEALQKEIKSIQCTYDVDSKYLEWLEALNIQYTAFQHVRKAILSKCKDEEAKEVSQKLSDYLTGNCSSIELSNYLINTGNEIVKLKSLSDFLLNNQSFLKLHDEILENIFNLNEDKKIKTLHKVAPYFFEIYLSRIKILKKNTKEIKEPLSLEQLEEDLTEGHNAYKDHETSINEDDSKSDDSETNTSTLITEIEDETLSQLKTERDDNLKPRIKKQKKVVSENKAILLMLCIKEKIEQFRKKYPTEKSIDELVKRLEMYQENEKDDEKEKEIKPYSEDSYKEHMFFLEEISKKAEEKEQNEILKNFIVTLPFSLETPNVTEEDIEKIFESFLNEHGLWINIKSNNNEKELESNLDLFVSALLEKKLKLLSEEEQKSFDTAVSKCRDILSEGKSQGTNTAFVVNKLDESIRQRAALEVLKEIEALVKLSLHYLSLFNIEKFISNQIDEILQDTDCKKNNIHEKIKELQKMIEQKSSQNKNEAKESFSDIKRQEEKLSEKWKKANVTDKNYQRHKNKLSELKEKISSAGQKEYTEEEIEELLISAHQQFTLKKLTIFQNSNKMKYQGSFESLLPLLDKSQDQKAAIKALFLILQEEDIKTCLGMLSTLSEGLPEKPQELILGKIQDSIKQISEKLADEKIYENPEADIDEIKKIEEGEPLQAKAIISLLKGKLQIDIIINQFEQDKNIVKIIYENVKKATEIEKIEEELKKIEKIKVYFKEWNVNKYGEKNAQVLNESLEKVEKLTQIAIENLKLAKEESLRKSEDDEMKKELDFENPSVFEIDTYSLNKLGEESARCLDKLKYYNQVYTFIKDKDENYLKLLNDSLDVDIKRGGTFCLTSSLRGLLKKNVVLNRTEVEDQLKLYDARNEEDRLFFLNTVAQIKGAEIPLQWAGVLHDMVASINSMQLKYLPSDLNVGTDYSNRTLRIFKKFGDNEKQIGLMLKVSVPITEKINQKTFGVLKFGYTALFGSGDITYLPIKYTCDFKKVPEESKNKIEISFKKMAEDFGVKNSNQLNNKPLVRSMIKIIDTFEGNELENLLRFAEKSNKFDKSSDLVDFNKNLQWLFSCYEEALKKDKNLQFIDYLKDSLPEEDNLDLSKIVNNLKKIEAIYDAVYKKDEEVKDKKNLSVFKHEIIKINCESVWKKLRIDAGFGDGKDQKSDDIWSVNIENQSEDPTKSFMEKAKKMSDFLEKRKELIEEIKIDTEKHLNQMDSESKSSFANLSEQEKFKIPTDILDEGRKLSKEVGNLYDYLSQNELTTDLDAKLYQKRNDLFGYCNLFDNPVQAKKSTNRGREK
jgi:hypothetical protein